MTLQIQTFSKYDWLEQVRRSAGSLRSVNVAKASLRMFELFCKNQGLTESQMIESYQEMLKIDDKKREPDIRSVCLSLDKFIQFLDQDHDEIILRQDLMPMKFKKKSPKTIKTYFGFIKSYLRKCHAVKLSTEDIKDYMIFPKLRKEPRKAISLKILKKILNKASPERKAIYYTLISSGMRIGEVLTLTKENFHLNENPVRITIKANATKTKEGRETYVTSEALEKIKPLLEGKKDKEKIFTRIDDIDKAVIYEEGMFANLRERLGLLERYDDSIRFVVNLHCFRAYFHTKASQKHGSDYANALDGHGSYLKQYYRETPEERAKKYKELEPNLFIESIKMEADNTKDKIIEDLQDQMKLMQDAMIRANLLNKS